MKQINTMMKRTGMLVLLVAVGLTGCTPMTPAGDTTITFSPSSGFPQNQDPAEFAVAGGSITASGGTAGTRGQPGLYADDLFAWDFLSGPMGRITFTDLKVVKVAGYWVHPDAQSAGATMTVRFSGGGTATVASAPVSASGPLGQSGGFFDPISAPDGETIDELTFDFDEAASTGDVAALDVLALTFAAS